MTQSHINTWH